MRTSYCIDKIFVDNQVKNSSITRQFLNEAASDEIFYGEREKLAQALSKLSLEEGKRTVFLTSSRGDLVKKCPGMITPYLCCNLNTVNVISNCPASCSYCFLQFYLNHPAVTIYTDVDKAKQEIEATAEQDPKHLHRFTTGEFSDSLFLDCQTGFSTQLVEFFARLPHYKKDNRGGQAGLPNALLELKTKTANVSHLLELNHQQRTVVSWSINTPQVIKDEERGLPSLQARLKAACKCQEAGYLLGFHFDPLICYPNWQQDYQETVRILFEQIDKRRIAWISLGTFRFQPGLENEIKAHFPYSKLVCGELIKAADGKIRYIKPIRYQLYRSMLSWIKKYGGSEVFAYLCMEVPATWRAVMDYIPQSKEDLDHIFANQLLLRGLL